MIQTTDSEAMTRSLFKLKEIIGDKWVYQKSFALALLSR